MGTLKDEAKAYTAPQTKNITELEKVSVDMAIEETEFNKTDGGTFTIKVINIDGEYYRVPVSVLKSLKEIMIEKPETKFIKVNKSGEGLKTTYTVIPL